MATRQKLALHSSFLIQPYFMRYSFELLEKLYVECLDKSEGERLIFIEESCSDNPELKQTLIRMLSVDEGADDFFDLFQKTIAGSMLGTRNPELESGSQVGKYTIKKLIGRGGMSNVYLAERSDGEFEQLVAVKCLPHAQKHIALDKAEQQLLAKLQHPGIATLYDAGKTTAGISYFVMEYIDGKPIDDYVEQHDLTTRDRLDLFLQVTKAVSYAHRHLILHLDLKASNILVTETGQVKLLDFGIATALQEEVPQENFFLGTPQIAAPEQMSNTPLTLATDVYQLGILLHKLLTGKFPGQPEESDRGITRADLSHWADQERRALDSIQFELRAIINRCLEKNSLNRYANVDELADDIENFVHHQPVAAVNGGRGYRFNRFIKRNRVAALSAMLVCISLVIGTMVSLWQAYEAREQRDLAIRNEQVSAATKNFLIDLFMAAHPSKSKGDTLTVFQFLDLGYERSSTYDGSPEIKLDMLTTFGKLYRSLGDYKKSSAVLDSAFDFAREAKLPVSVSYIQAIEQLALYQRDVGNYDSAQTLLNHVLRLYDEIQYPKQDSVYTTSLKYLAFVVKLKDEPDSAIRLIEQVIALEESIWPEANNLKLAESYYILGTIYKDQKEYEKSIAQISQSLAICQSVMGEYYPGTLANFNLLATLHNQAGQHDQALQYALRTPAIAVKLFGEWHSETGTTMANLGKLLLDLDQYDSAYKYLSRAHQIREKIFSSKPHVHTMISLNNLINLFHLTGQIDSASLYLEKGLMMSRSERIQDRQRVVTYRLAGEIFKSRGQYDSALRYYQQSLMLSKDNMIQDDDPRLTYLRSKIQETDSLRSTAIAP